MDLSFFLKTCFGSNLISGGIFSQILIPLVLTNLDLRLVLENLMWKVCVFFCRVL